ncbi:MAG: hypothetical protein NC391_11100 [Alistipes timonensis]|nr:hypothetical protein [Alistipes timonensis]
MRRILNEPAMPATILSAIALVALAVLLMGVKALFVKGGRFPQAHSHELRDIPRRRKELRESRRRKPRP